MTHANTLLQVAADFFRSIQEDTTSQSALHEKQLQRAKALAVLHAYQRYRRGSCSFDELPYTARDYGLAIDFCIRELRQHFRPIEINNSNPKNPQTNETIGHF